MSDYEKFQDNEQVRVLPADMSTAQADEARANLHGNIAKMGWGFANQLLNNEAAKKGAKDAVKASTKGEMIEPISNLTEAGRIYNAAAAPVEKSMIASQMQQHVNSIYQGVMNNPASSDPKTGNLAQFSAQIKGYYDGMMGTIPDEYKAYATSLFNSSASTYGSRIADKVASYEEAQNNVNLSLSANSLANNAAQQVYEATSNPNLEERQKGIEGAHETHMQAISLVNQSQSHLNGTPVSAAVQIHSMNKSFYEATILGHMEGMIRNYHSLTNPQEQQKQALAIREFANEPFANKDLDKSAPSFFNQNDKMILQNKLNAQANSIFKLREIDLGKLNQDKATALVDASHGKYPTSVLQQVALHLPNEYPKFHSQVDANMFAYSYTDKISNLPIAQAQEKYNQLITGASLDMPGADSATKERAKSIIINKLKTNFNRAHNEPVEWAMESPRMQQKTKDEINRIYNTTTDPMDSQKQQQMASNLLSNPVSIFQTRLSPPMENFYQGHLSDLRSVQNGNGISSQQQVAFTKASAANIVQHLNQLDGASRVEQLKTAEENTGDSWPMVQRSLLHAGLKAANIIATSIHKNPDTFTITNSILAGANASRDPNFYKIIGTTASRSFQDVAALPNVQQMIRSFSGNTGIHGTQYPSEIIKTIASTSAWKIQNSKSPNWESNSDIIKDTANQVLNGMYQNSAQNGIRIPYNIKVGNTSYPVNMDTVYLAQAFFNKNLEKYANLPLVLTGNKENDRDLNYKEKLEIGSIPTSSLVEGFLADSLINKKDNSKDHHYYKRLNEIQQGRWLTLPNGDGLYRVDMYGNPVKMKNGKQFQFKFLDMQNNPPSDFVHYEQGLATSFNNLEMAKRLYNKGEVFEAGLLNIPSETGFIYE